MEREGRGVRVLWHLFNKLTAKPHSGLCHQRTQLSQEELNSLGNTHFLWLPTEPQPLVRFCTDSSPKIKTDGAAFAHSVPVSPGLGSGGLLVVLARLLHPGVSFA